MISSVLPILMTYQVYILYSKKLNRFYVGQSTRLEIRLVEHNNGESRYTSEGIPWILLWATSKPSLREAEKLERKLKNLSQKRKIKFMLKYQEGILNRALMKAINGYRIGRSQIPSSTYFSWKGTN